MAIIGEPNMAKRIPIAIKIKSNTPICEKKGTPKIGTNIANIVKMGIKREDIKGEHIKRPIMVKTVKKGIING